MQKIIYRKIFLLPRLRVYENQSEAGGLASTLQIKSNVRVMLTMNVDLQDRLIDGQSGTVKHIEINDQHNISKVYIKFDDNKAGLKRI